MGWATVDCAAREGVMLSDGNGHTETKLLARVLMAGARFAVARPWVTVVVSLLAVVGSLYLAGTRLSYRTSRAALLDAREEYHQRWLKYVEEFGEQEDVVVVVEGQRREAILPALDEVVRQVSAQPRYFQSVLHEINFSKIRDKGLFYLSAEELRTVEGFLCDVEPIVRGGWQWLNPGAMATGMCAKLQEAHPDQLQQSISSAQVKLAQIAESLFTALSRPGAYKSPWPELSNSGTPMLGTTSHRMLLNGDRIGVVLLKLAPDNSPSFIRNAQSIALLRSIIGRIKTGYPQVSVGLTGLPIMEHDEMQHSQSSMTVATVISFLAVLLVMIAGFGGLRHALIANVVLLVGSVVSLGYTTLVVGHLNILSCAFGAVLSGLGIDYSIYLIARYVQLRHARHSVDDAIVEAVGSVGPGITVAALSTAIAFFMTGLTGFTGVAELGIVTGGGILLCLLASMVLLPAMVRLIDARRPTSSLPVPLDFHRWINPVLGRPRTMLLAGLVVTVAATFGMSRLRYDNNLLNLQPEGLECVELEQKLVRQAKDSAYFALSLVKTPEEAVARKARFLQLPTVQRVDEIITGFPTGVEEKRPIIQRIRSHLAELPERAPSIPVTSPAELGQMLSTIEPLMSANLQMAHFQRQLQEIRGLLGRLPAAEYYSRLSEYQQRVAADLLGRLHLLRSVSNPEPPGMNDLPAGLVSRFVGHHGSHLLRIYVKGDFWDTDNMRQFVAETRSVDPDVTGNPIQIYEASTQMRRSYEHAALYSIVAVLPVVFLDLGSVWAVLLAVLPLGMGLLQMFGLMGILDIPLNPANMISLALMLGMGMDNGVHIIHDYLDQRGPYRMSPATGVAVVLNTLTTMVGYGVLIIADHRGLQSLGRVLTIGMTCCLFSALIILPALLAWISGRRTAARVSDPARLPNGLRETSAGPVRIARRPGPAPTAHSADLPSPHWVTHRQSRVPGE
jgi:hopanoid biosynthesis associated RND transporter like protein HpnN